MGKGNSSKKKGHYTPFLTSSLARDADYENYLANSGGFSSFEEIPEETWTPTHERALDLPSEQAVPSSGSPSAETSHISACSSKTEYRKRKEGSLPLAEALMEAVPIRNIGGRLWARLEPPLYRPLEVPDVSELLRGLKKLPKSDNRVSQSSKDVLETLKAFSEIKLPEMPVTKGRILFHNLWFDVPANRPATPTEDDIIVHKVNAVFHTERLPTPAWNAFLESVSGGDKSIQALIESMIGYLMLPEQDAKVFFILGTAPDSGKSALGHFLQRLFGTENCSAVSLHSLRSEFALAPIIGKKLNISMDLPADSLKDSAVGNIKSVTGDDLICINVKYEPHVQQRVMAKFVFGTNSPIILDKPDPAFYNRMIYIPFMHSIPKNQQRKNLLEELWAERDGIVQRGVLAARKLIENNYEFPRCKRADNMVRKWSQSDDFHVLDFVRDWCVCGDLTTYSGVTGLHIAYVHYCAQNGFDPVGVSKFSRILNDHAPALGIRKRHKNTGSWFDGIILHPNLQLPPEIRMKFIMPE